MSDIQSKIKEIVDNNKIVVFMKGTPDAPQCGFSAQVIQVLNAVGAKPVGINVLADPEVRNGIKEFTNWPTIPQIFVNGKYIGGCDIVTEMYDNGELKEKLKTAGLVS